MGDDLGRNPPPLFPSYPPHSHEFRPRLSCPEEPMAIEVVCDGVTQELRRARKRYSCTDCGKTIKQRDSYYCRYFGSGLAGRLYPKRLCLECAKKNEE